MKMIVNEIHLTNNECVPNVEIELDNVNELPNIKVLNDKNIESSSNYKYPNLINFSHGFFDSLSPNTLNKLNDIFSINNDFINYKLWTYFVAMCELNIIPIKTKMKTYNSPLNNKILNDYFNNNKSHKNISQTLINEYKTISKTFPFLNRTTNKISKKLVLPNDVDTYLVHDTYLGYKASFLISREVITNNEIELLYAFLDIIFSSKYRYYVKKCDNCNSFFITTSTNTKYCNRIDTEYNRTCSELVIKNRLKYGNLQECEKVEKRVRSYFNRQQGKIGQECANIDFLSAYDNFKKSNPNRSAEDTIAFLENYRKNYASSLTKL